MVVCWSQRLGRNRHAVLQHPFDDYDPAEFPRQPARTGSGMLNSLASLAGPAGLIFAGPLADAIGVAKLFIIGGVGSLLCGPAMWLMPNDQPLQAHLKLTESDLS